MKPKHTKNILYVVNPTIYNNYDVIAIGDFSLLKELKLKHPEYHLIKKSQFGGIPLVVLDTFDHIGDANKFVNVS